MIIPDSSLWIALLRTLDSQHDKAIKTFESFESQLLYIPEYIVLEVVSVLQNKKEKIQADIFLEKTLNSSILIFLPSSNDLFQKTQNIFLKQDKKLSFVDCSLVALSDTYKIITFDEELHKYINS